MSGEPAVPGASEPEVRGAIEPEDLGAIAAALLDAGADPESTLAAITAAAVGTVPGADWAGISVMTLGRVESRAPTGELPQQLDDVQTELGEGPCMSSLRDEETVRAPDLTSEPRWPAFAARAVALGVCSMLSFRLLAQRDALGALNLYASRPQAFDDEAEAVGRLYAAHAALALTGAQREANLRKALENRDLIGQAKGILMERFKLTAGQAFELLARASQETNRKVTEIAEILTRTGELLARSTRPR